VYAGSRTVLHAEHHAGVAVRIGVEFGSEIQRARVLCDAHTDGF
jgi:hypothetical protein